jgi:hypothetical protein
VKEKTMVDNLCRIGMSDGPNLGVIGLSFAGLFVMFDKELTSIFSSPQAHKASLSIAQGAISRKFVVSYLI